MAKFASLRAQNVSYFCFNINNTLMIALNKLERSCVLYIHIDVHIDPCVLKTTHTVYIKHTRNVCNQAPPNISSPIAKHSFGTKIIFPDSKELYNLITTATSRCNSPYTQLRYRPLTSFPANITHTHTHIHSEKIQRTKHGRGKRIRFKTDSTKEREMSIGRQRNKHRLAMSRRRRVSQPPVRAVTSRRSLEKLSGV